MFGVGDRVRLKGDPSVTGVIADHPMAERAGRSFRLIELPNGDKKRYPSNQLEDAPAQADPVQDLKDGKFSAPSDLRKMITHLRMTGRLADMIYSLGATNTDFHAYQFKPVLKLLNSPLRGLLIADEVGLGKTIEAGLIWTELVARFDSRRLLIVCPKPLREKWREELRSKFNVDAQICSADALIELLDKDQQLHEGFAAIASFPGLRPPSGWADPAGHIDSPRAKLAKLLEDADDTLFDLVVFDEAHHLRNPGTLNHELAKLVTGVADHKLLLSATPINLRANDLRSLLKLIDPDTFEREWLFDVLQEENQPYVKAWEAARNPQASRAELAKLIDGLRDGRLLKTDKRVKRLHDELSKNGKELTLAGRVEIAARIEEMSLLGTIINRTRRRDVAEIKVERRPRTVRWTMSEVEREFYDAATKQIADYACEHDINEGFLLAQTQRLLASSLPAAFRHWGQRTGNLTADDKEQDAHDNTMPGPLVGSLGEICEDAEILAALEAGDTKLERLTGWLRKIRDEHPEDKVIVFSSFRKTIGYLARRLLEAGFEIIELHGGVDAPRQTIVDEFAGAADGTILLTSEVGGEGLDLQFCRILFNWDLPWNPMRVEQRVGRLDRIGQQSPSIDIVNCIAAATIEQQVYDRLYERLGIIEGTLGDFEPILGEVIREFEVVFLNPSLNDKERASEMDRAVHAAAERKAETEKLEREAPGLIAHGDSILQKIIEAQSPHKQLTSDEIREYISGILIPEFRGTRIERDENRDIDAFRVRLSASAQAKFDRFRERNARKYPTRFGGREAGKGVLTVFGRNPEPSKYRTVEAVPMTHPLSRFSAELLDRKQAGAAVKPVTAFQTTDRAEWNASPGRYVIAVERWSIESIVPVDKLAFVGEAIDGRTKLDEDDAERILMEALADDPRLMALTPADNERAHMMVSGALVRALKERRRDFEEAEAARHYDLVYTQKALLGEQRERKSSQLEEQIDNLLCSDDPKRRKLVPAIEGQRDKFIARMDLRLKDIEKREAAFSLDEPVLVGVAVIDIVGKPE